MIHKLELMILGIMVGDDGVSLLSTFHNSCELIEQELADSASLCARYFA